MENQKVGTLQLEFNLDELTTPKTETCECRGNGGGGCVTHTALDDDESCPGCGAPLYRERSCLVCRKCGYKSCGD